MGPHIFKEQLTNTIQFRKEIKMNVKQLKEILKDLPDDMIVVIPMRKSIIL